MLNCREITELSSDYLDGELSWWTRTKIRLHLGMCRHCSEYVRQMNLTVGVLRKLTGPGGVSAAAQAELMAAFRAPADSVGQDGASD